MSKRRKTLQRRKNYYPTLLLILISWGLIAAIVYFIDPQTIGIMPLFFSIIFFALLLTLSIILANSKRGLIISVAAIIFLLLRFTGVGNIINLVLIIGIAISIDLFFGEKLTGKR